MEFPVKYLLNVVYAVLLTCLSPVIVWRVVRYGRYRRGLRQKLFGLLKRHATRKRVVWFHAVSVGEVIQLEKIVRSFQSTTNDAFHIVVTTSTDTGFDLATERFVGCQVEWCPLDFSWAVSNAIGRLNPELLVLMELEIWPNLLTQCHQMGVPTAIINARMSERSFRGYSKIGGVIRPVLSRIDQVMAQSTESGDRLVSLGVHADRMLVTGSIKFDGIQSDRENIQTRALRTELGIANEDIVFIAGSTQDPEESVALEAWLQLNDSHRNLRLIIVPRHRERFDDVAALVESRNVPLIRRSASRSDDRLLSAASQQSNDCQRLPVILLDTIGELSACWGLADFAFVGGSFGNRGGQNMLEPAAYGATVMFGPNTRNFRDIVRVLLSSQAAIELQKPSELLTVLAELLQDRKRSQQVGIRAVNVVQSHQGAVDRTIMKLLSLVDDSSDLIDPEARLAA